MIIETKKKNYIVQIGYFDDLGLASEQAKIYTANGIKCSIEPKLKGYRIQAGAFSVKTNAQILKKEVKAKLDQLYNSGVIKNKVNVFIYKG